MAQTPPLIGSKDACLLLDVNRSTLTRWVEAGRLVPVTRLPGKNGAFLFKQEDVDRLAAEYGREVVA